MKSKRDVFKILSVCAALCLAGASAQAQGVQQWDFTSGNLSATAGGADLEYITDTASVTDFGTTEALGLPAISGEVGNVMKIGKTTVDQGLRIPVSLGGSSLLESWTMMFDILSPAASSGKNRALIEGTDIFGGAEFGINTNNQLTHAGAGAGAVLADTWHRIVFVVDADNGRIDKYVDGDHVGGGGINQGDLDGGRFALDANSALFTDDTEPAAATEELFVSSIQLRNAAITGPQVFAVGGPAAAGLPVDLPPVPSFISAWTPAGPVANRDTAVGAVINQGDTTVDQASIKLSVDGAEQSAQVSANGSFLNVSFSPTSPFAVGSKHTIEISYTDDADGAKSASREFTAALFFQDFEGLELQPNEDEGLAGEAVWTRDNGPEGWVVDDSGVPGAGFPDFDGVTEWAGWSFADKDWWVQTAGDQRRSEFSRGIGNVAVADPDEWDDAAHDDSEEFGWYKTSMTTPEISLEGVDASSLFLQFDSSWRDEFDSNYRQSGEIKVSYDGADPVQVLLWLSDPASANFHDDAPNENIIVDLDNPAGAKKMTVEFRMFDAGNDWWWAVDNVTVNAGAKPPTITDQPAGLEVSEGDSATFTVAAIGGEPVTFQWFKNDEAIEGATGTTLTIAEASASDAGAYKVVASNPGGTDTSTVAQLEVQAKLGGITIYSENFDGLPLGPNVDEGVAGEEVWTKTAPEGWTIDDTDVPGAGFPEFDGVTEWAGWSYADRAWWANTAGDQRRTEFTKGTGTIAIADGDEWDDLPHDPGTINTFMSSSEISLDGIDAGSVVLRFNSSWRPENSQTGNVTVSFDGGSEIEVVRLDSDAASENFKDHAPNDTITVAIDNPAGASNMVLKFGYFDAGNNWWWAVDNIVVTGVVPAVFSEDFEGLSLGASVDEEVAADNVWTDQPPAGWSIEEDLPGVDDPEVGVREWEGWGFADRAWWAETAGDQRRTEFTKGTGTVAIADGDEWDDKGDPDSLGTMNTFLSSPSIDITGESSGTLILRFNSSWRPENDQTANVTVSYDGADAVEVVRFDSGSGSDNFKDHAPNDTVTVGLANPAGAKNMVLTFGYFDAKNNWWWAIDNVEVVVGTPPAAITEQPGPASIEVTAGEPISLSVSAVGEPLSYQWFFGSGDARQAIDGATEPSFSIGETTRENAGAYSVDVSNGSGTVSSVEVSVLVQLPSGPTILLVEDFNGLALGSSVDEEIPADNVWTDQAPAGWSIVEDLPGVGDPDVGVREWEGWGFADREWWSNTAGDQRRTEFTKGTGAVAIADGDEWDDKGDPDSQGTMNTFLSTPAMSLAGIEPGSVVVRFDSSWRPENDQTALVTASFDGGDAVEVVRFDSDSASPNFKDHSTNDTVTAWVNNPAGASSVVLTFAYVDAKNNWWWAIDNIEVSGFLNLFSEGFDGLALGANVDEGVAGANVWTKSAPTGWSIDDSAVPGAGDPENDGVTEWAGWSFADRAWWAETAGDQRRTEFTRGTGTIAVADGDEWDDQPRTAGNMSTLLSTPAISLAGIPAGAGLVVFDSSWRPENDQTAVVTASFDGGAAIEIVRFDSDSASANFKDHAPNDTVWAALQNPAGASNVVLTFGYLDAGNNWWWAIDNVRVTSTVGPGAGTPPVVPPVLPPIPGGGGNGISSFAVNGDGSVTIIFTGSLTAAATVDGPYLPIPGAVSPLVVNPGAGGPAQFYIAR